MEKSNLELTEALSAPLGEVISSVAKGVAEAQAAMDLHTIETLRQIYQGEDDFQLMLQKMGYKPTWYKIPKVEAEVVMSLSISASALESGRVGLNDQNRANKFNLVAAPVDANYVNRYNYDIKGASKVTFTIVPVPPTVDADAMRVSPALLEVSVKEARDRLNLQRIPFEIREDELNDNQEHRLVTEIIDDSTKVVRTSHRTGEMLQENEILILFIKRKVITAGNSIG